MSKYHLIPLSYITNGLAKLRPDGFTFTGCGNSTRIVHVYLDQWSCPLKVCTLIEFFLLICNAIF